MSVAQARRFSLATNGKQATVQAYATAASISQPLASQAEMLLGSGEANNDLAEQVLAGVMTIQEVYRTAILPILRENVARRHLTKSQRAMMAAQARRYSVVNTENQGLTQAATALASGVSRELVKAAEQVLGPRQQEGEEGERPNNDLTLQVLAGVMTIQAALDTREARWALCSPAGLT